MVGGTYASSMIGSTANVRGLLSPVHMCKYEVIHVRHDVVIGVLLKENY